jgi:hypothetical protein
MSFGDHAILWLHIAAAVFTIGPTTAAIMATPRYIRSKNHVLVGYLLRTTRIYAFGTLLVLVFGLISTQLLHKFSQWWISASLTLFVVAFVLLILIMREQRKALTLLDRAAGAAVADAVEDRPRSEFPETEVAPTDAEGEPEPAPGFAPPPIAIAPPPVGVDLRVAAVERGRIVSLGGVTALIWLVILVFMVWH